MKNRTIKTVLLMVLLAANSCNDPETVVTDIVHTDGSVTRRIEMKSRANEFEMRDLQIPYDSTWIIRDSIEVSSEGDTVWVKRAEKLFKAAEEINSSYASDSGANKDFRRTVEFSKHFRWFNTEYRFEEVIDKIMTNGYPVSDFLDSEELNLFYYPQSLIDAKMKSADSLELKILGDRVDKKIELWGIYNTVSEWIGEFCTLIEGKSGTSLNSESLRSREKDMVEIVKKNKQKFDSLWENGTVLREMIGESDAARFKNEADSAMIIASDRLLANFKEYSLRMVMPGELFDTNGFIDSSLVLIWPVRSDFFMTEPYVMWAESRTTNLWAWIFTAIFLLFVGAGLSIRFLRK